MTDKEIEEAILMELCEKAVKADGDPLSKASELELYEGDKLIFTEAEELIEKMRPIHNKMMAKRCN